MLKSEAKIIKLFHGSNGFVKLHWYGKELNYFILVMDLLGKNLESLQHRSKLKKFSLKSILLVADQLLKRIEQFHQKDMNHRDLKPENFCIGKKKANNIYLIDFGLSKRYRDLKNKIHAPQIQTRGLTGTARYSSINTHLGYSQSRRDDMEQIAYCLVYLLKGELPWQGIKAKNKDDKYQMIMEMKMSVTPGILCQGLPQEFSYFFQQVMDLSFEEEPNYDLYRLQFKHLYKKLGFHKQKQLFDWEIDAQLKQEQIRQYEENKRRYEEEQKFLKIQEQQRSILYDANMIQYDLRSKGKSQINFHELDDELFNDNQKVLFKVDLDIQKIIKKVEFNKDCFNKNIVFKINKKFDNNQVPQSNIIQQNMSVESYENIQTIDIDENFSINSASRGDYINQSKLDYNNLIKYQYGSRYLKMFQNNSRSVYQNM